MLSNYELFKQRREDVKNEIWNAIVARTADWNEIIEFINYYRATEISNFNTLQLLCFSDIENYASIHAKAGDEVDNVFYSYVKYFFWPFVYPGGHVHPDTGEVT